jgi:hypothetical protein
VRAVPGANRALQAVPQSTPAGTLDTVPDPVPALVTVTVSDTKVAVTLLSLSSGTVHEEAVPPQSPPQPPNAELESAAAVNVTDVPSGNGAEHVEPQSIPAGVELTAPPPLPLELTVSVASGIPEKLADT